jgi:hypothetical protein
MKKLSLALLTGATIVAQSSFAATIPSFDAFANVSASGGTTYTYPGFLSHQTNAMGDEWYAINTGSGNVNSNLATSIVLTNIGLSYAGLPASTGNAIVIPRGTTGMGARMFLTNGTSPISAINYTYGTNANITVYYSMILQAPVIDNLAAAGEFCFGFNNQQTIADQSGNPGNWCAKVYFKKIDTTHYVLGVNKMGNASTVTFDTTTRSTSDQLFIVVGYTIDGSSVANNDTVRMWINPSSSSFGQLTPPSATVTGASASDSDQNNGGFDNFQMGVRSTSQPDLLIVDEIRLGTNWAQVTGGPIAKGLPATGSVIFGSNVTLNAKGSGNGLAATYKWQRNGVNLTDGGNVTGSQTQSLTITGASQDNAGTYTFVSANSYGSMTSSPEVLSVTGDPRILTQPVDQSGPPNSTVTFDVNAVGTPTLTYQWFQNGNPLANGTTGSGMVVSGATTTSLTLANIKLSDSGATFSCTVNNGAAMSVTSSNATLIVQDPAVTTQPQNVTIDYQGTATFSINALGTPPLTYRWQLNGANLADGPAATGSGATISGSATTNLTITSATYLDQGSYTCVVTHNATTATSSAATLTVNDPIITAQPVAASLLVGNSGNFSVTAVGSPTLTYQWRKGTNALTDGVTASGSTISGSSTANLTISSATTSDSGNYNVVVSGPSTQTVTSSNAAFTVVAPAGIAALTPATRTQRVGDHLAYVVTPSGTGPFSYAWSFNGTPISGVTSSALVLTNIQLASAGTYSVTISNAAGVGPSANATLNVVTNFIRLSEYNLIVARVGDGAQSLNNTIGNTLYLDQFQPNGSYVSTIMVPDAPTAAFGPQLIAGVNIGQNVMLSTLGSGNDAYYENVLTRSANQQYINFTAYNTAIPSPVNPINNAPNIRGVGAVNAIGYYQLAYTNSGLYSGGNMFIRSVASDDGLVDFWTTGAASSAGIKYAEVGVSSYATGNGIPALAGSNPGTRVVDIAGGNLVYSDAQGNVGLNGFSGLPKPASGSVASALLINEGGSPVDFAASPDLQTVYIADDRAYDGTQNGGGIQRWDTNSSTGGWSFSYAINTGVGTIGASCLTVDFSASPSWGPNVNGAIIYATTTGKTNSLVKIVDSGASSSASVLSSAGPNQILRGVRFGPVAANVQITTQPQDQDNFVGQTVSLNVGVSGDAPFTYQWRKNGNNIAGATGATLSITNAQTSDSGSYSVVIGNLVPSSATSSVAVVSIAAVPPTLVAGLQSRVQMAGEHMVFVVNVSGSAPFTYTWTKNGSPISSASGSVLPFNNLQVGDSGTYKVVINNANGQASSTAALTVTPGYQQLYPTNIVAVRVGDGAQPLSSVAGNTLYFDQFAPDGTYVNTIMLPDTMPNALIAEGGSDALTQNVLTRSQNGGFLNIGGYNVAQPYVGAVGVGNNGNIRGIGAIDAYGYFTLALTNSSLYNASTQFRSAVSSTGTSEFWTTGVASSIAGVKYVHDGGATTAVAGGLAGTRVVDITPSGNLAFTDVGDSGMTGLNAIGGLPTLQSTPTLFIDVGPTASPNDFAVSPGSGTVYIADDESFSTSAGNGGIERWDNQGGTYVLSYTLSTGGNSLGGARCLTVDFSANGSWGPGANGAVIYATTTEGLTNKIVRIVDNGPDSPATIIATAGPNQLYRGMRFGPTPTAPVTIINPPQSKTVGVGGTATFMVTAGGGPFTYQWQLNGANLTDGPSPSGTGAIISGANSATLTVSHVANADSGGNYGVIVSNPTPGGQAASTTALLTVVFSQFGGGGTAPVVVNPDHSVQLNFSGTAGNSYRIWSSSDIALKPVTSTWRLLGSGTFTGGADSFVDTNAPAFMQQFYTITVP